MVEDAESQIELLSVMQSAEELSPEFLYLRYVRHTHRHTHTLSHTHTYTQTDRHTDTHRQLTLAEIFIGMLHSLFLFGTVYWVTVE